MNIVQPSQLITNKNFDFIKVLSCPEDVAQQALAETVDLQITILQDDETETTLVASTKQMLSPVCLKAIAKDILRDRMAELLTEALAEIDKAFIDIVPVFAFDNNNELQIQGITDASYILSAKK